MALGCEAAASHDDDDDDNDEVKEETAIADAATMLGIKRISKGAKENIHMNLVVRLPVCLLLLCEHTFKAPNSCGYIVYSPLPSPPFSKITVFFWIRVLV